MDDQNLELNQKKRKTKLLSHEEIASFCRQTALILKAGITPAEGMEIMIPDTVSEDGKAILQEISDYCRSGGHFKQALEETGAFPDYVVTLVALGEESGTLDNVFDSLADYYEREADLSYNIRSAVSYPLIMIAMMFVIIIVLVVKVLPIFRQVFAQLGTEMSPLAERLMRIGSALSRYAVVITVVLLIIVCTVVVLYHVPSIRKKIHNYLSTMPLTRGLYDDIAAGRFASSMYLAFSSGMDTFHGLDMISDLVENESMQQKIDQVRRDITNGNTMAEAIASAGIFSNLYSRMIKVGFTSGSIDTVFKQIATSYEDATNQRLRKIVAVIEPTLVIIVSIVVGIILLSVLLPLMGIMSSIG